MSTSIILGTTGIIIARFVFRSELALTFRKAWSVGISASLALAWIGNIAAKKYINQVASVPDGVTPSSTALFTLGYSVIFAAMLCAAAWIIRLVFVSFLKSLVRPFCQPTDDADEIDETPHCLTKMQIKMQVKLDEALDYLDSMEKTSFPTMLIAFAFFLAYGAFSDISNKHAREIESAVRVIIFTLDFEENSYCPCVLPNEKSVVMGEGRLRIASFDTPSMFETRLCDDSPPGALRGTYPGDMYGN